MRQEIDWDTDLSLDPPVVPTAEVDGTASTTCIYNSDWDWTEATRHLKDRKSYVNGGTDVGAPR
jgi:hypothetical protein